MTDTPLNTSPAARFPTRYLVWGLLCLLAAIFYLQRTALGPAESTIRDELGLSKEQMGWIQGAFFLAYSCLQLPAGWLCQRFGSRWTMTILCVLGSLACGLTGWTNGLLWLLIVRMTTGVAQAGALPGIAQTLSVWSTGDRRSTASGYVAASMQVGAILAAFMTPRLVESIGWRSTFWWLCLPGLAWAIVFGGWFRDDPRDHAGVSPSERELLGATAPATGAQQTDWRALGNVLRQPIFLLLCGQQFFRAAGYIFFGTWFSTYLQETFAVSKAAAGAMTSWALVGALGGAIAGGFLPDQLTRVLGSPLRARKAVAIGGQWLCAVCIVVAYAGGQNVEWVIVWMTIGSFFAAAGGPAAYAATIDVAGKNVGSLFGVMNMSGNFGAALFPIVVPYLLGPQQNDWRLVVGLFALVYVLAGAIWWGIRAPQIPLKSGTSTS